MGLLARVFKQHGVGLLALFVALSGTAYAASKIGAHDIRRNAIRSSHIKAGQVKISDLAPSVRGLVTGGGAASSEQLQIRKVDGAPVFLAPGEFDGAPLAQCPEGYVVVGTGFNSSIGEPNFVLAYGTFVGGFFANFTSIAIEPYVQALCARNSTGGATTSRAAELNRYQHDVARTRLSLQN